MRFLSFQDEVTNLAEDSDIYSDTDVKIYVDGKTYYYKGLTVARNDDGTTSVLIEASEDEGF